MSGALNKTDIDDLFSWLHDEHISKLVDKADAVCKSFVCLNDTDIDGQSSKLAVCSMSDMFDLMQILSVYKAVQLQINTLANTE